MLVFRARGLLRADRFDELHGQEVVHELVFFKRIERAGGVFLLHSSAIRVLSVGKQVQLVECVLELFQVHLVVEV